MAGIETIRPSDSLARPEVKLRRFTPADIPLGMELKNLAGWSQTAPDWAGYLEFEPEGCWVAELAGRSVATATAIRYGARFGWIGMVLVHPDARRFGIGTALLRHAIAYLQQRGTRCVKLDATPMGRKVYVPLGFRDEFEVSRYEGVARAAAASSFAGVRPLVARDLPEVAAFDAASFGAERMAVLRAMAARNPGLCGVYRERGQVVGYLIAREGQHALQVGPWLARDATVAKQLWQAFAARADGRMVFVDVPHPNRAGLELLAAAGFTVQRGFTRMYLGENSHPGEPQRVFGTSGAEKG